MFVREGKNSAVRVCRGFAPRPLEGGWRRRLQTLVGVECSFLVGRTHGVRGCCITVGTGYGGTPARKELAFFVQFAVERKRSAFRGVVLPLAGVWLVCTAGLAQPFLRFCWRYWLGPCVVEQARVFLTSGL